MHHDLAQRPAALMERTQVDRVGAARHIHARQLAAHAGLSVAGGTTLARMKGLTVTLRATRSTTLEAARFRSKASRATRPGVMAKRRFRCPIRQDQHNHTQPTARVALTGETVTPAPVPSSTTMLDNNVRHTRAGTADCGSAAAIFGIGDDAVLMLLA